MHLKKVISGGQTGVDRAGLDAAIQFGIEIGGTAPRELKAEDGRVPAFYGLKDLRWGNAEESVAERTRRNVLDADVTLVITAPGVSSRGTDLTIDVARAQQKKWASFQLDPTATPSHLRELATEMAAALKLAEGSILNIAGPRESEANLYWRARECLVEVFAILREQGLVAESRGQQRQEAFELFKHWDSIRWQGPAWLSGTAAVVGSIMSAEGHAGWRELVKQPLFVAACLTLGTFGTLCVILQTNLIVYHRRLERALSGLALPSLPFSFSGKKLWTTASAWLLVYTVALSIALTLVPLWHAGLAPNWWVAAPIATSALNLIWPGIRLFGSRADAA
ncbi:MAG TPA: putative molybdenum carrier protein [Polyangia bacterium]|nr:putative molybdenum carrier protein [Polyangia bacterium]